MLRETKCCGQWYQKLQLKFGNCECKIVHVGTILVRKKYISCKDLNRKFLYLAKITILNFNSFTAGPVKALHFAILV